MKHSICILVFTLVVYVGRTGENMDGFHAPGLLSLRSDPQLVEKTWKLYRIDDRKGGLHKTYSDYRITLTFAENTYSGYYGCNRNYGSYEITGKQIKFKHDGSTKRMCPEIKTEEFLQRKLKLLSYSIHADTLVLSDNGGLVLKYYTQL
jgi:heat shock protein HslJ